MVAGEVRPAWHSQRGAGGAWHTYEQTPAHTRGASHPQTTRQTDRQGKAMCGLNAVKAVSTWSVVVHRTVNQVIWDVRSVTMRWEGEVSQWGCRPGSSGG